VSVGEALAELGRPLGIPDPRSLSALLELWPELVGETVARHVSVRSVRAGVLTVAVDAPAWATQVRFLEGDLVGEVSRRVAPGFVETLHVVVEGAGRRPARPGRLVD
jgi:predicted nucleic acid-binding Zn ribbon protein